MWYRSPETSSSEAEIPDVVDEDDNCESASEASLPEERPQNNYHPRVCRICLETVLPTFHPPTESENLPNFLKSKPRVVYESSDPELGRLLRPCKCKGTSRYVHEGCLRSWRHADPSYGKRNYWQCPTCGFQYHLERLRWARWISSTFTQLVLTIGILFLVVFLLGFVADPIINLYVDPLETIYFTEFWEPSGVSDILPVGKHSSGIDHFVKGLASLGVLSFIKAILALSPWQWWNLRSSGLFSGGRSTGRSRLAANIWLILLIGIGSFLWAVYKGVRAWSRRSLVKAGERVMDVPQPDDDDEDPPPSSSQEEKASQSKRYD